MGSWGTSTCWLIGNGLSCRLMNVINFERILQIVCFTGGDVVPDSSFVLLFH